MGLLRNAVTLLAITWLFAANTFALGGDKVGGGGDASEMGVRYPQSGADQYRLIHHKFAGLAGIEKNVGASSDYTISEQITKFLVPETVYRLAGKPQSESIVSCDQLPDSYRQSAYHAAGLLEVQLVAGLLANKNVQVDFSAPIAAGPPADFQVIVFQESNGLNGYAFLAFKTSFQTAHAKMEIESLNNSPKSNYGWSPVVVTPTYDNEKNLTACTFSLKGDSIVSVLNSATGEPIFSFFPGQMTAPDQTLLTVPIPQK